MFSALTKAIAQCSDPAFRKVFLRALGASVLVFVAVWIMAWFGLSWLSDGLSAWIQAQEATGLWGWILEGLQWLLSILVFAGVSVASVVLFPAATMLVMGFLLEDIAQAVEGRHYPDLAPARAQPVGESVRGALSFVGVSILLNLLVMPLYLIPAINLFVFYGLNGYLLGREYFELVAVRRVEATAGRQLRRRFRGRVFMAGVIVAFFLTLPLVNLVIPIVATAFMVHIFHDVRRRGEIAQPAT